MTVDATLLAWLRSRLPATAGAAVSPIPAPGLAADGLLGEEAALVARAGPARQADFRAGRIAARQALSSIGIAPAAILAHPAGDPIWPDGIRRPDLAGRHGGIDLARRRVGRRRGGAP